MLTATALPDLLTIEKIREQELEEARVIQWAMLPGQMLRTSEVMVSHEFQPVTEVGGDFLDYFRLPGCWRCARTTRQRRWACWSRPLPLFRISRRTAGKWDDMTAAVFHYPST
jgi:hypothetical protein